MGTAIISCMLWEPSFHVFYEESYHTMCFMRRAIISHALWEPQCHVLWGEPSFLVFYEESHVSCVLCIMRRAIIVMFYEESRHFMFYEESRHFMFYEESHHFMFYEESRHFMFYEESHHFMFYEESRHFMFYEESHNFMFYEESHHFMFYEESHHFMFYVNAQVPYSWTSQLPTPSQGPVMSPPVQQPRQGSMHSQSTSLHFHFTFSLIICDNS